MDPRPIITFALAAATVAPALATAADGPSSLTPVARVAFDDANDLAFRDGVAYVSATSGVRIIDVSDPERPRLVGSAPCSGKDIGVLAVGGRVLLTVSSQSGDGCPGAARSGGIRLIDATDPSRPIVGRQVALRYGSHTNTPYGDSGLVFNSAYDFTNPTAHHRAEIVDVRDPLAPRVAAEFRFPASSGGGGCHDILAEPERDRAFCAALTETQVWDTTNPLAPRITATIANPLITIHHSTATAKDGNLLIIGDEWAGALAPGGCTHRGRLPQGALWFYDLTLPAPAPLGYWAPKPGPAIGLCTAHNFNVVEGTDLVVGSAYTAGTFLVDVTNPTTPLARDQDTPLSAFTWSAYAYRGYAFTGDSNRGMDVYRIE